jgi:hypothetical protein
MMHYVDFCPQKVTMLYCIFCIRRRCQEQLLRVNNSLCIIESHANAIEGTELNKSILNTIRASGDAIKRLSVKGGIGTVEEIISEVETQMEHAAEITKVISAGNHLLQFSETDFSRLSRDSFDHPVQAISLDL